MGRWTQSEEDSSRLPEGLVRIGYDSDTERYTFQDRSSGVIYQGDPGAEYGKLTPMNDLNLSRPYAFSDGKPRVAQTTPDSPATTFQDFLPSYLIVTAAEANGKVSPRERFRAAVRAVVHNLRRSVLSARISERARDTEEDSRALLRRGSQASASVPSSSRVP